MTDNNKTEEFLQKLAPCIERGELEACVEEAARVAREMGIGANELWSLSGYTAGDGEHRFAYVIALAAAQSLEGNDKASVYSNAGFSAQFIGRLKESEKYLLNALDINPKDYAAHNNYAILLEKLDKKKDAEKHYTKAIEINPQYADAHYNYALLLTKLNRNNDAEKYYKKAIEIDPKHAPAHGAYGLFLIEYDRRIDAWKETEMASSLLKEVGYITISHLAKGWFYRSYSEKNFNRKRFRESSGDADKAGEEYLKAAEYAEGELKDNLKLQGNVLKAKSFVRKIPENTWYNWIFYRFGNPDISELIENLKNAATYYEKASHCSAGERKEICNACFSSISVFSETLKAMSAFIKGDDAEIKKDKWLNSLKLAHKIYTEKKLKNGAALVDTLKQLIKCVDELAEHRKVGLHIQEERVGKCYNNLLGVSERLDGALKIISEHAVDAIREYAKKQGMGFVGEEKIAKSSLKNWLIGAIIAILLGIISNRLFSWDIDLKLLHFIRYIFFNQSAP